MYALFKNGKQITGKIERKTDIITLALMHGAIADGDGLLTLKQGYTVGEVKE